MQFAGAAPSLIAVAAIFTIKGITLEAKMNAIENERDPNGQKPRSHRFEARDIPVELLSPESQVLKRRSRICYWISAASFISALLLKAST